MKITRQLWCALLSVAIGSSMCSAEEAVRVTIGGLTLPTYAMGPDAEEPAFRSFHLGFDAHSPTRSVYPYALADNFSRDKKDVTYEAITLENEFVKAVVLPDLRGRLQGAIDKRNGWDFLYFNHVVKPGDISVRGGWIAGGIEWNHPGGHGYTQFARASHTVIENADGSRTVLVAEIEPVRNMKWETAVTLRPGSLALETETRLYGIAPCAVPFCSSTNAAMHATEGLEAIYPEGSWVTGHGKKYMMPWPNYEGIDHRWIKNLQGRLSIFTEGQTDDFYGCYAHDKNAGTVIVADSRSAPGKKYFSWGWHDDGRLWDKLLSDNDGGYVELQVQAFWDNLGYGYAWLDPLEVKRFKVFWYPVKDLGGFVKANEHAALNVRQQADGRVRIDLQAVRSLPGANVQAAAGKRVLFEQSCDLGPAAPWSAEFTCPPDVAFAEIETRLLDASAQTLLAYRPLKERPSQPAMPKPRRAPSEATADELFAWGKSFYQDPFGSEAESYYQEMVRRDAADSRGNRELGLIALQRGQWSLARERLTRALDNDPLVGGFEAHYDLGLAAAGAGDFETATVELNVASRVSRLKPAAMYQLALVAAKREEYARASSLLGEAIADGCQHPRLWSTLAVVERKRGDASAADRATAEALRRDPLEFLAILEQWQRGKMDDAALADQFDRRDSTFIGSQLYAEGAASYVALGDWESAKKVLAAGIRRFDEKQKPFAMLDYLLAYCQVKAGDGDDAIDRTLARAATRDRTYVFPYRVVEVDALQTAVARRPADAAAWQYLGNALCYLRRHDEAAKAWSRALDIEPQNAAVLRCLALKAGAIDMDYRQGAALMERAVNARPRDRQSLMELDRLLALARDTPRRLQAMDAHFEMSKTCDDLALQWAKLLVQERQFARAAKLMDETPFHAAEISSRHVVYAEAHTGLGEERLAAGKPQQALVEFARALEYPRNLTEGAPGFVVATRIWYLMGLAHQAAGDNAAAADIWAKAIETPVEETSEGTVYRALAMRKLGRKDEADALLGTLVAACKQEIEKIKQPAFAAKSEPRGVRQFVVARACEELGRAAEADSYREQARAENPDVLLDAREEAATSPLTPRV